MVWFPPYADEIIICLKIEERFVTEFDSNQPMMFRHSTIAKDVVHVKIVKVYVITSYMNVNLIQPREKLEYKWYGRSNTIMILEQYIHHLSCLAFSKLCLVGALFRLYVSCSKLSCQHLCGTVFVRCRSWNNTGHSQSASHKQPFGVSRSRQIVCKVFESVATRWLVYEKESKTTLNNIEINIEQNYHKTQLLTVYRMLVA